MGCNRGSAATLKTPRLLRIVAGPGAFPFLNSMVYAVSRQQPTTEEKAMAKDKTPKRESVDRASVPYQGRQSGKSSNRWFGGGGHPKGNGASTGDGQTSDKSILGKIAVIFKSGNDQ